MNFFNIIFIVITILIVAVIIRVIKGETVWDRLMGINMISSKINIIIVLLALYYENGFLLDIAIAYGILGFIGIILMARFL